MAFVLNPFKASINTEPDFINTQAIVARCLVMNLAYPQIQDALSELLESSELSSDVMFFSAASLGIEGYEVHRESRHLFLFLSYEMNQYMCTLVYVLSIAYCISNITTLRLI